MKKRENNSSRASALQISLSVALLALCAILFASSFKAAPQAAPDSAQPDTSAVSQQAPPNVPAPPQQNGFYPPLPVPPAVPEGSVPGITVALPIDSFNNSTPASTVIIEPMTTTLIDPTTTGGNNYVGFQGDFTFDSGVVTFANPPVQRAGLTSDPNWNVSANIFPAPTPTPTGTPVPGTIRTLRISAFMGTFTPLAGMGTLFELRMLRVSSTPGDMSPLVWRPDPDNFFFIDDNLNTHAPRQTNGVITITGTGA